jgi:hypothetical protein
MPRLKMRGATPPLSNMFSRRGVAVMTQNYIYLGVRNSNWSPFIQIECFYGSLKFLQMNAGIIL